MDSKTLRKKFLDFFEKNDHVIIPSAPLVPSEEEQLAGKEKVLFTSAGMQQLIPYLMGKPHPQGKRLADVQKCVRTDDIEEVGDATHHTFFEMLGNWSLGDYWKEGAIELSFKFLTEELEIPLEKLAISVFAGDEDAPKDEESANKWKSLGIPEKRIAYLGKEANWWPTPRKDIITGELKNAFGPCGPDTEMFIWTGKDPAPEEFSPKDTKWVEVWNDVFMEFNRKEDGTLEELPQKNVDTGMGLERMLAVLNGKDNDYETDLFLPIIEEIKKSKNNYSERSKRIIADHLKAAVFILSENVEAVSHDQRGSVAKILITNAITQENKLLEEEIVHKIISHVNIIYQNQYPELQGNVAYNKIQDVVVPIYQTNRGKEFEEMKTILNGVNAGTISLIDVKKRFPSLNPVLELPQANASGASIAGSVSYYYHQSKGISEPVIQGTAQELNINPTDFESGYKVAAEAHHQASRWIPAGEFKGGLADHSEVVTKYHTATHLLHQALRDVLGPSVFQKGSNITSERLRFDFSFDRKMTDEEIKKVEDLINQRIKEDLKVDHKIVSLDVAKEMNAIGLFDEKYADKVSIYGVGPKFSLESDALDKRDRGGYYSLEFCGGPHVEHTGVIEKIKIIKEEAISAGMRRIRAQLTN